MPEWVVIFIILPVVFLCGQACAYASMSKKSHDEIMYEETKRDWVPWRKSP